jgi:polysaccharide export outer membrane protein
MRTFRFPSFLVILTLVASPVFAQQPYVLGPEDVIEVTVYGQADLTRTVAILPDGTISLPLAGTITVSGLTIDELTKQLAAAYALYIKNPQVAVIVKGFRKLSVSVIGQVTRPGTYDLKPGATILDALSAAGGLTDKASVSQAHLIRASGESQPLFLEDLLVRQDMQRNIQLQTGDTLLVPEELANRFYVLGDVNTPGVFVLRGEVTVVQALAMAGGPAQRGVGTARTVHIVRRNGAAPQLPAEYGKVEKLPNNGALITVDLQAVMQRGDLSHDVHVQAGDIIVVPQAGLSNASSIVSILAGLATIFKP